MRKLPIGIQSFEKLREDGFLYVDKTAYIYRLAHEGTPIFLSRPRRFGKSLFLSTLRAYWEAKKELFEGLAVERLEKEYEAETGEKWEAYPVFYFDFNKANFKREMALEEVLSEHLDGWEKTLGDVKSDVPLAERFRKLLEKSYEQTGKRAVVLVDEYDKPLLEVMEDDSLEEHNKAVFKGFFSTLKSYDGYLKFVFLTGVTKFSKVSIFSDLNQLNDISMDEAYAGICGITEAEMERTFEPEIKEMAKSNGFSYEECLAELKKMYDGYHFCEDAEGVYNPFSLINALNRKKFGAYWFSTGTPTFLVEKLKKADFDIKKFTDGELEADEDTLSDYRVDNPNPVPLLYQTGYLTIKDYDKAFRSYLLEYPNNEVKYGMLKSLAPDYLNRKNETNPLDIISFGRDIKNAKLDSLRKRLTALFASLPYVTDEKQVEQNFQNVVYIVFTLLGQFVKTEVHSALGRADVIVETEDYIYVFEFKRDKSAEEALEQIEEKGYAIPYAADLRKLYKIGVNFDSESRNVDGWIVHEGLISVP